MMAFPLQVLVSVGGPFGTLGRKGNCLLVVVTRVSRKGIAPFA